MRSKLSCVLAILILCAAVGGTAFAQEGGDGEGSAPPVYPDVQNQISEAMPFLDTLAQGQPVPCGQPADRYSAEIACHIDAKITISARMAHWIGLDSRTVASGVAGGMRDDYTDAGGDKLGRTYFLEVPSSVKAKLRAKHVRALGVQVAGTITVPGQDKIICDSDHSQPPKTQAKCDLTLGSEKRLIWGGQDGEMLCWRFMPWGVATPAKWGKMCPRPMHV